MAKYQLIYAVVNPGCVQNTEAAVRFNLVQLQVGWSTNIYPFSYGQSQSPRVNIWFKIPGILTLLRDKM